MKTVKLQILAEDIKSTDYTNGGDCAITRALKRAGINAHHDGFEIVDDNTFDYIASLSIESNDKVNRMYAYLDKKWDRENSPEKWGDECAVFGTLKPTNFEFEIKIEG